jgi:hypothetical protein
MAPHYVCGAATFGCARARKARKDTSPTAHLAGVDTAEKTKKSALRSRVSLDKKRPHKGSASGTRHAAGEIPPRLPCACAPGLDTGLASNSLEPPPLDPDAYVVLLHARRVHNLPPLHGARLLDYLVRLEEEQRGNGEAKLLGGLQVDD